MERHQQSLETQACLLGRDQDQDRGHTQHSRGSDGPEPGCGRWNALLQIDRLDLPGSLRDGRLLQSRGTNSRISLASRELHTTRERVPHSRMDSFDPEGQVEIPQPGPQWQKQLLPRQPADHTQHTQQTQQANARVIESVQHIGQDREQHKAESAHNELGETTQPDSPTDARPQTGEPLQERFTEVLDHTSLHRFLRAHSRVNRPQNMANASQ